MEIGNAKPAAIRGANTTTAQQAKHIYHQPKEASKAISLVVFCENKKHNKQKHITSAHRGIKSNKPGGERTRSKYKSCVWCGNVQTKHDYFNYFKILQCTQ